MNKKYLLLTHGFVLISLLIIAFSTNGVGGGGDSLTHFFISQLSWSDPSYFLHLWGKPVFTFFSSPFAQLGFTGIKVFNITCGVAASYFSCLVALKLGRPWPWAVVLIAFIAPAFYSYLFSGLTEPFAALITVSAIYFCLSGSVSLGFLIASFLPFARSEATIFLLFFVVFGLLNKHWKKLPLLATAYLLYGVTGYFSFHSFLWMFDSPYDPQGSVYGSGDWFHYLDRLQIMLAIPGIVLAGLGMVQFFRRWFLLKNLNWKTEPWLIHGIFFSLLVGHSVVWALGIYGSAGLERTLITVFPLLWLIMHDGLILLKDLSKKLFKYEVAIPLVFLALQIFNVWTRPVSKYYWETHLELDPEKLFFRDEVAPFIKQNYPDASRFVMDKPYMAVALEVNFMNPENRLNWSYYGHPEKVPGTTLWLFDSYYVPVQYGIPLEKIREEGILREVKAFEAPANWQFIIFEKAPAQK